MQNNDLHTEELKKRVEELESHVRVLEKDLIHDALTGLKTRAFFEEEVNLYLDSIRNIHGSKRKEWFGFKNMSFLFLDIDHFKTVNDTYGHDIGDVVLKRVAEAVNRSLRGGDTAARWGGEEMVVALLGANEEDAFHTALRINELVKSLKFPEAPELKVTISIGIATADESASLEELVKRADKALYLAKENGRNMVIRYSEIENN
jgi:two-component system cell cycle response regulator